MNILSNKQEYTYQLACENSLREVFNTAQAAQFIGVSKSQLENWRVKDSDFKNPPKHFYISSRVRYRRADLLAFLEQEYKKS